jgi:DNA-directed RNA polymerase subunit F
MKVILPNIRNAGKEWIRYIVNEELKKAIADAETQGKLKERILAISALAKYNKLDQDEAEELPWDEIIPVDIEPVNDPTVLDALPVSQDEIDALYKKYSNDIEIENADYEDVKDDKKEDLL